MARKFKNRNLIIIFVILVGLLLLGRFFRSRKYEKTLKTDLVQVDTSSIDQILLYPRIENNEEIRFLRRGDSWSVQHGEVTAEPGESAIQNIFSDLLGMKAEQLVARDQSKWQEYHVDDSLGTRVILKSGNKKKLDIIIGRFNYQPAPGGYSPYGRNQGRGLTYVRLGDEPEVYIVEGFLSMTFNQGFSNWRNQLVLDVNKNNMTRISCDYPNDSGFVLTMRDSVWMIDGTRTDSARTEQFLNSLSRKSETSFVDDFTPLTGPDFQLRIDGSNMQSITVVAYKRSDDQYIINSSQNPEAYFSSPPDGLFEDIFWSAGRLLAPESVQ